ERTVAELPPRREATQCARGGRECPDEPAELLATAAIRWPRTPTAVRQHLAIRRAGTGICRAITVAQCAGGKVGGDGFDQVRRGTEESRHTRDTKVSGTPGERWASAHCSRGSRGTAGSRRPLAVGSPRWQHAWPGRIDHSWRLRP